jgi:diguanylate cyclase (GGDEF)-like protein
LKQSLKYRSFETRFDEFLIPVIVHPMLTVFIIGAGAGGSAILDHLMQIDGVKISGMADLNPKAPAIIKAKEMGIPVYDENFFDILQNQKCDLLFDLTGDSTVRSRLLNLPDQTFHLVTGECTHLILGIIRKLEAKDLQMRNRYEEHRILSEISLAIAISKTSNQIFDSIVTGGMEITGMPAGSLSIYKPDRKELFLVSANGFSSEFYLSSRYRVRPGGLTEHILSQNEPVVVTKISEHPEFNNPILLKEGIQSLIAIPLISDEGPVGILYVDDFKERSFSPSVIEVLKLLAIQATIAIQKQQAFEQIKALSILDPVTGLFNRRYFNDILVSEMERAYRLTRPLSLILFDIDHFKGINDRYGHMTGDQVLKDLAGILGSMLRRYDVFCRFGGDEMIILMSDTDIFGAQMVAERLRTKVAEAKLLPAGSDLSCSFGVNALEINETPKLSRDEFLNRTDHALYEAKNQGRNRVITFNSGLTSTSLNGLQNNPRRITRPHRRNS